MSNYVKVRDVNFGFFFKKNRLSFQKSHLFGYWIWCRYLVMPCNVPRAKRYAVIVFIVAISHRLQLQFCWRLAVWIGNAMHFPPIKQHTPVCWGCGEKQVSAAAGQKQRFIPGLISASCNGYFENWMSAKRKRERTSNSIIKYSIIV